MKDGRCCWRFTQLLSSGFGNKREIKMSMENRKEVLITIEMVGFHFVLLTTSKRPDLIMAKSLYDI